MLTDKYFWKALKIILKYNTLLSLFTVKSLAGQSLHLFFFFLVHTFNKENKQSISTKPWAKLKFSTETPSIWQTGAVHYLVICGKSFLSCVSKFPRTSSHSRAQNKTFTLSSDAVLKYRPWSDIPVQQFYTFILNLSFLLAICNMPSIVTPEHWWGRKTHSCFCKLTREKYPLKE